MFILDTGFTDDYFELPLYQEAVEKHGELDYTQCFGFVPLLALGGFKDVDHLDKVKILEGNVMEEAIKKHLDSLSKSFSSNSFICEFFNYCKFYY